MIFVKYNALPARFSAVLPYLNQIVFTLIYAKVHVIAQIVFFLSDGVQGIESQQALNRYIQKLDDNCIREMDWIDAEATLQMLVV